MNAREDLATVLMNGGAATNALATGLLDAYRNEVLREALAAIEDPDRRKAAAAHFNMGAGLGWEAARGIVRLMLNPALPPVGCPDCRHFICDGDGLCGAIVSVSAISNAGRCQCTTGAAEPGDGA